MAFESEAGDRPYFYVKAVSDSKPFDTLQPECEKISNVLRNDVLPKLSPPDSPLVPTEVYSPTDSPTSPVSPTSGLRPEMATPIGHRPRGQLGNRTCADVADP